MSVLFVNLINVSFVGYCLSLKTTSSTQSAKINPSANICAIFNLENDKIALSKDDLKYALPYVTGDTKCIMASNHFVH